MMAAANGIFAGGDAVPSARTATVAIGHGKRAARGIDAFLSGDELLDPARHELANFDHLNTWYYADAPRTRRPELERARRQSTFEEVVGGLTEENALFEARRCLSCGNCFECDNCFGVCPDNAVIKLGSRSVTSSTTTSARAAASACRNARAARSTWFPSRSDRVARRWLSGVPVRAVGCELSRNWPGSVHQVAASEASPGSNPSN